MIPALAPTPAVDPAALPDDRAGTTYRFHIDEDLVPQKRAVLKHEPADPLAAVFTHDAADIAAAIEACGTNDPVALLGHLKEQA